jgi:hypothetical protein
MPIPQIIKHMLSDLDEKQINDTIYTYYKEFGSNPKILNDMIKTYISVIVNEKLSAWNPISSTSY